LLAAVNGAAAEAGLGPGLPLADARAMLPDLRVGELAPADDGEALTRLAQWCGRYTPWTAVDPTGDPGGGAGILLDVTGCAHLFGGEAALLADLVRRIERLGFTARAALAETPGAAWAAARFVTDRRRPSAVLPPGQLETALADLPPSALRLSPACCELLDRLGLRRIGDLYGLPPAGLTPRLGEELVRRLRQALGQAPEPISPQSPVAPQLARRIFPEPIATAEDIARALDLLARDLCRRLDRAQLGARRLELSLYRVDGSWRRWALGASRQSRDPDHLTRLFANHLDKIDPGFGIEVMTLGAPVTETLSALQLVLGGAGTQAGTQSGAQARTQAGTQAGAQAPPDELAGLIDRLESRLGAGRLWAPAPVESHLPERAVRPAPPLEGPPAGAWRCWQGTRPPRPLRLLEVPEPIEAMALLPDHPPVQFRWRRMPHTVTRAEGPERLAPEWWRQDRAAASPRDYFRVEDQAGRRYWLYRAGQDWFLHGLFG
jgi:protein ImuB